MKKEVKKVQKNCCQCGKVKLMPICRLRCLECLRLNAEKRFQEKREKIANNPEDKLYLVALPCEDSESKIIAGVYPFEVYDSERDVDLIRRCLSKYDGKRFPITNSARQYKFQHKKVFGNLSRRDLETVKNVGNILDDISFEKYQEKLKAIKDPKERKKYINSFIASFPVDGED